MFEFLECIVMFLFLFSWIRLDKARYFLKFVEVNVLSNTCLSLNHVNSFCSFYLGFEIRIQKLDFISGINEEVLNYFKGFIVFIYIIEFLRLNLNTIDVPDFLE